MKKRSIALILLVLMICSLLAGCMKNAEAVNFAGDIDLGEDGVITKDVFSQLRDSGEIASICGKSGEISYKWTVPGTEVTNPQDLCMAVAITEKTDGSVEITLKSDKSFGFLPTLSVTLNDKWDAISASVYDANGKKLQPAHPKIEIVFHNLDSLAVPTTNVRLFFDSSREKK